MSSTVRLCVTLNTEKTRVLVIDDHAGMREGLTTVVNAQPDMIVVGEASDGQQAINRFRNLQPDVSLLDWNLPVVHGDEVLTTISAEFPTARVIVVTALSDDESIRRALCLGAKGYLHKDMLRRELLPAIRAVREGKKYVPDKVANRLKKDT